MSSIADWAYKNPLTGEDFKITCRKFIRYGENGKAVYGEPFEIRGYFMDEIKEILNQDGSVFVSTRKYITDSNKIDVNDLVGSRRVVYKALINSLPLGETVMDWWLYT